jgi:hypothetical protein
VITDRFPDWQQKYAGYTNGTNILDAYDADYLYCGRRERFWDTGTPAPGTWVQEAFRQGDTVIYRRVAEGSAGAEEFNGCGPSSGN